MQARIRIDELHPNMILGRWKLTMKLHLHQQSGNWHCKLPSFETFDGLTRQKQPQMLAAAQVPSFSTWAEEGNAI